MACCQYRAVCTLDDDLAAGRTGGEVVYEPLLPSGATPAFGMDQTCRHVSQRM